MHLSMAKEKTKQPNTRVTSFSFKKIKSNLKMMNPMGSSNKDKSRAADAEAAAKHQKHRPMTNEEAIQNANMDMKMIRAALSMNEGQMTEDQTRSYRNSLRGTTYGRTVYGDYNRPRSALDGHEGAKEDDEDVLDQSGSSENNENEPGEAKAGKRFENVELTASSNLGQQARALKTENDVPQDDHDKFEIPLGTPQFSQTNATKIEEQDDDFELDVDTA